MRAIAQSAGAHQPRINYHFESKEALGGEAVDHLDATMRDTLQLPVLVAAAAQDSTTPAVEFAAVSHRLVRFVALHPELNRIMMHATAYPGPRPEWLTGFYVRPCFDGLRPVWKVLVNAGIASPIHNRLILYVLNGSASLVFVNAHESSPLVGEASTSETGVKRHPDGLIAMLLPGLEAARSAVPKQRT